MYISLIIWNPINVTKYLIFFHPQYLLPDGEESTSLGIQPLILDRSRSNYESAYIRFEKWCEENNKRELDENVLFAHFEEKSKVQKSSSLWAQYSMLKCMILMRRNIDISKYSNLLGFLRKNAVGYQAAKSKSLTKKDIDTFLREAPDNTYLLMKVALIIGVAGECSRYELSYMLMEDVRDEGSYFRITIPNSLTKTQREFIILAETINGLNLVEIIRKYIQIRPSRVDQQRFFVAYRNGKCVNQPVGVNTMGIHPKRVASFLGLPDSESYIGYRFEKTTRRGEETAITPLLPVKSKMQYEANYTRFQAWCEENKMENIDEETLLTYFQEKSSTQKSSTLWAVYSMLKTVLLIKKNIDISKYTTLVSLLKQKSVGYHAKKTSSLSRNHVDTFLREADDKTYLLTKVAVIIGVAGSCKVDELFHLRVEDVKDEGSYFRISIPSSHREFIILAETINGLNLVEVIRKYINLRPQQAGLERFFIAYRNGKCINSPVGKNTIGVFPRRVATFLGLPDAQSYTGYRAKKYCRQAPWTPVEFTGGFDE